MRKKLCILDSCGMLMIDWFLLLNIHVGKKAYWGQGWVEKGDRRVKPWNRCQPERPRLPPKQLDVKAVAIQALCNDYSTTQLLSQLLCRTVTKTPLLENNWSRRSPALSLRQPSTTSLLLISSGLASSWESKSPPSSWSCLDSIVAMAAPIIYVAITWTVTVSKSPNK